MQLLVSGADSNQPVFVMTGGSRENANGGEQVDSYLGIGGFGPCDPAGWFRRVAGCRPRKCHSGIDGARRSGDVDADVGANTVSDPESVTDECSDCHICTYA